MLAFAASDIQDCFHHFELPDDLQAYFGLDPLPAKFLGIRRVGGQLVSGDTPVFPLIRTAPMGCSWSMYWCQRAHDHCLDRASLAVGEPGIGPEARVRDRAPFPGWGAGAASDLAAPSGSCRASGCVNLVFADNNAVFGLDAGRVASAYEAVCTAVAGQRLPLHEKTGVIHEGEFLGVEVDGVKGVVGPSSRRVWRVRRAFEYLSGRPRVTGDDVLHVLGHGTYLFLFRQGLLSIFRNLYDFASTLKNKRARLWAKAAQEARVGWRPLSHLPGRIFGGLGPTPSSVAMRRRMASGWSDLHARSMRSASMVDSVSVGDIAI